MSFNPMFGIGECTAQAYAFKILWLQHRRVNGIVKDENDTFDMFYYRATSRESMALLPTGELTMGMRNGYTGMIPDTRYEPVDFINLYREGEPLYTWSRRMEREYPWEDYRGAVDPEDWHYLTEEIFRQKRLRSAA